MIPPESPFRAAGAGFSADAPAPTTSLPPHRARLWDFPAVAVLGAHTYWRRPELTNWHRAPLETLRWWHRLLGAVLGVLWGASMAWAGLVLLSPGRDVAVSIWLPWRWWQPLARLLTIQVVLTPAALSPSLLLWLYFDVDVVAGMAVTCVLIVLGTVAMACVDARAHRRTAPKRVPGMVSITGLASRSGSPWGPSRFLRDELLPWATNHNVGLYAAAATPAHARVRGSGLRAGARAPTARLDPPERAIGSPRLRGAHRPAAAGTAWTLSSLCVRCTKPMALV